MRNRAWWYVGAMIVIVLLVGAWTTRGQASPKVLWEYKCVFANNVQGKPEMEKPSLTDLGAEGWELVAVESVKANGGNSTGQATYYFKRPR